MRCGVLAYSIWQRGDDVGNEDAPAITGEIQAATEPAAVTMRSWPSRRTLAYIVLLVPLVQVGVMQWLIWGHSANVPYWDEWETVILLMHVHQGTLSWYDIWHPHANAHRILLPRLIDIMLAELTGFNRQLEMVFDIGVALAGGWLLWRAADRTLTSRRLALALVVPLSLVYLSLGQFANWFAPFQIQFILAVFGTACCVWALAREDVTYRYLAVAILGAGIATLSSLHGLLVWVAFALVVLVRASITKAVIWVGCGALAWVVYFRHYPTHQVQLPLGTDMLYSLTYLGAPIGYPNPTLALIIGYVSLLLLAGNIVVYWRSGGDLRRLLPWLGLAFFVLLCTQATAVGRLDGGIDRAVVSRYQAYSGLWWIALIVIAAATVQQVVKARGERTPASHISLAPRVKLGIVGCNVAALGLMIAGILNTNVVGTRDALIWLDAQRSHQHYVVNYDSAPLQCLAWYYLPPDELPARAAFLESQYMGVWGLPGVQRVPAAQAPKESGSDCAVKPYSGFID
jgi:hypothetical protein